jgi:hypothetical protein
MLEPYISKPLIYIYIYIYIMRETKCLMGFGPFGRWGELESGQTTIAFTPLHQHETDELTGAVQIPGSGSVRQAIEVCFAYADVDAAYKVCDLHELRLLVKM